VRAGAGVLVVVQTTLLHTPPVSRAAAYAMGAVLLVHGLAVNRLARVLGARWLGRIGISSFALDLAAAALALLLYSNNPGDSTWVVFALVAAEAATRYGMRGAVAVFAVFVVADPPIQIHAHVAYAQPLEVANVSYRVGIVTLMAVFLGLLARERDISRQGLERRVAQLSALAQVASAIRARPNREEVLGGLLRALRQTLHADGALAATLDETGSTLTIQRPVVFGDHSGAGYEVPVEGTLQGEAVRRRQVVRSENTQLDQRARRESALALGVHSAICAPMELEGRVIGVVTLLRTAELPFTEEDEKLLAVAADQAVIVLENARLHEEAARLASTDDLTGLLNRRAFLAALASESARAARYGERFAVLSLDMDQLKEINDGGGHAAGDRALCALADVLRREVRSTDSVARLGGDEFVVLMPRAGVVEARLLAERVRGAMNESMAHAAAAPGIQPTVSIGGIVAGGGTPDRLMEAADHRLYQAKAQGRDAAVIEELSEAS
jgi:diguanylate cyclase (GGDEF)-like protein